MYPALGVEKGRWVDVAQVNAVAKGTEPDPTCFVRATSVGSRIDIVLANRSAVPMLGECGVIDDSPLPTHKPVACELRVAEMTRKFLGIKKPHGIPLDFVGPDVDAEAVIADRVCRGILVDSATKWAAASAAGCIETLWSI